MSRGLMLMEAIECIRPEEFIKNFDFQGIEPFTLLMIYKEGLRKFIEFRWDGANKYIAMKDTDKPSIWSSSTLYTKEVQAKREALFQDWLKKNPSPDVFAIREFHTQKDPKDPANSFLMKRDKGLQTVSTTSIELKANKVSMVYEDHTHPGIKSLTLSVDHH